MNKVILEFPLKVDHLLPALVAYTNYKYRGRAIFTLEYNDSNIVVTVWYGIVPRGIRGLIKESFYTIRQRLVADPSELNKEESNLLKLLNNYLNQAE